MQMTASDGFLVEIVGGRIPASVRNGVSAFIGNQRTGKKIEKMHSGFCNQIRKRLIRRHPESVFIVFYFNEQPAVDFLCSAPVLLQYNPAFEAQRSQINQRGKNHPEK